jgi:hypothetical protein
LRGGVGRQKSSVGGWDRLTARRCARAGGGDGLPPGGGPVFPPCARKGGRPAVSKRRENELREDWRAARRHGYQGGPAYRPAVARSSPLARARGEDRVFRNDEKTNCGRTGVPPGGTDIGGDRRTARRCGREGGEDRATARRWPSPFPLCKQGGGGIGFFETTRKRIAEGPVCPKTRFFLDLLTGRTSLTQSTLVSH